MQVQNGALTELGFGYTEVDRVNFNGGESFRLGVEFQFILAINATAPPVTGASTPRS